METPKKHHLAVWWLSEADYKAIGEPDSLDGTTLPDYIKSEFASLYGRPLRGRLWSDSFDVDIDPWPDTLLARHTERCGGIVFHRRDLAKILPLPGFVTDLELTLLTSLDDRREQLGRIVRKTWIAWAKEQPDIAEHPHWLTEWDGLSERDKEVDRRIGEAIAAHVSGEE